MVPVSNFSCQTSRAMAFAHSTIYLFQSAYLAPQTLNLAVHVKGVRHIDADLILVTAKSRASCMQCIPVHQQRRTIGGLTLHKSHLLYLAEHLQA